MISSQNIQRALGLAALLVLVAACGDERAAMPGDTAPDLADASAEDVEFDLASDAEDASDAAERSDVQDSTDASDAAESSDVQDSTDASDAAESSDVQDNTDAADSSVAADSSDGSDAAETGDADTADAGEPCPIGAPASSLEVPTSEGLVRGRLALGGILNFRGVPFAARPLGDLRWRLPAAPPCYDEGVFVADSFGEVCWQYGDEGLEGSEDCLTLNIWAPPDAVNAPVFFWIHGGGHEQGASSILAYDGRLLAQRYGVVVVSINYRLGPFGFLAHPALSAEGPGGSGNYGMHDMLAALRWVQANISNFGGDPERVSIAGQSAGGVSVCRLLASPLAAGLFSSAAIMSGGCNARTLSDAESDGLATAAALACEGEDALACLRAASPEALMGTFEPLGSGTSELAGGSGWGGVVEPYALPLLPSEAIATGAHNAVPVIIGSTSEESGDSTPLVPDEATFRALTIAFFGGLLGPRVADLVAEAYPPEDWNDSYRDAFVAASSDAKFTCGARSNARALARAQVEPVYRYLFDEVADNAPPELAFQGAFHGIELAYLFGILELSPFEVTEADRAAALAMQEGWTQLAAGGVLGPVAGSPWPAYDPETDPTLVLDNGARVELGPRPTCDFWASFTE